MPHFISDHALGAHHRHDHGPGEFDHDHDHDFPAGDALEPVSFISLGLDVGSSSTQVAFSRLTMRAGKGEDRETLFVSPVMPTPFAGDGSVDATRLRSIVDKAFAEASLRPDDIDTGVVLLTGEAASRDNSAAVAALLADSVGDLVCASAGHHMEALLSAHGSGAIATSREGGGRRILLIDIGGGTTKLALVENGKTLCTAALAAGGRLLVIDRDNRITRLDRAGSHYARLAGQKWQIGTQIDPEARGALAEIMADVLIGTIAGDLPDDELLLTEPLAELGEVEGVMFAGGVGEYVYGRERRDFGDLGRAFGAALRRRIDEGALALPLLPPGECIRATVLGASEHSLQLSGETIYISSHPELLPRRNIPVVRLNLDLGDTILAENVAAAIEERVAAFDLRNARGSIALALDWSGPPSYPRVRALADGIARGLSLRIVARTPLYVLVEGDIAMSLGSILKEELRVASEVLVADGIETSDFDFVDLGRVRLPSNTVPVTIKSLLFGGRQAKSP